TFAPGIAGIGLLLHGLDRNRSALKEHGWQYRSGGGPRAKNRFATFPVGVKDKQTVYNLAWGSVGLRVASVYTIWTSHKYRYTVEQLELPAAFPPLMLLPANAYDKLMTTLGGQDLRVESADFNA